MPRTAALRPQASPPGHFLLADPGMAAALLSGGKTQMRVLPDNPLARLSPGDRIAIREPCIAARMVAGRVHATALARAEFAIFADGGRRHRDGSASRGRRPIGTDHAWITAMHMPRWASRATLVIESVRQERLHHISRAAIRAEGAVPLAGGLLWRWPRPIPGLYRGARRAFSRLWDLRHDRPGTQWADDPEVIVLTFRVEIMTVGN